MTIPLPSGNQTGPKPLIASVIAAFLIGITYLPFCMFVPLSSRLYPRGSSVRWYLCIWIHSEKKIFCILISGIFMYIENCIYAYWVLRIVYLPVCSYWEYWVLSIVYLQICSYEFWVLRIFYLFLSWAFSVENCLSVDLFVFLRIKTYSYLSTEYCLFVKLFLKWTLSVCT